MPAAASGAACRQLLCLTCMLSQSTPQSRVCPSPPVPPQTCYYAKVFEKDVPKALEILSDILQVGGAAAAGDAHLLLVGVLRCISCTAGCARRGGGGRRCHTL